MALRYLTEDDKRLIYDSETDEDICVYCNEEKKEFLLKLLNTYAK